MEDEGVPGWRERWLGAVGKRGQNKKGRCLRLFAALRPAAYANRLAELPLCCILHKGLMRFVLQKNL
jgi:hypothetical protein